MCSTRCSSQILIERKYSRQILKKLPINTLHKFRLVQADLFHVVSGADRTKLT
jgi:hypothetical protein